MHIFAINEARMPPRIGSIAIMSGTLLCAIATAGPALSADLPYDGYRPHHTEYYRPYYDRDYDRGCYRCSCCGGRRYVPIEERPVVERVPVAERHWVQRDYIERRYPGPRYGHGYGYPRGYRYSYYYPAPALDDPYYRSAGDPPAPVAYEYDVPRPRYVERPYEFRPAYEHEPPPRPAYEYEASPRPPATVPSGYYYGPGYVE